MFPPDFFKQGIKHLILKIQPGFLAAFFLVVYSTDTFSFSQTPLTFYSGLDIVKPVAETWSPNAQLAGIKAQEDLSGFSEPAGSFESVSFFFFADSVRGLEIIARQDGTTETAIWNISGLNLIKLDDGFLDSGQLLESAEAGGGSDFRSDKFVYKVVYYIGFTRHFVELPSGELVNGLTSINYFSSPIPSGKEERFEIEINPLTGLILQTVLRTVEPFGLIAKGKESLIRARFYSPSSELRGIKSKLVLTYPDDLVVTGEFNEAEYIFFSDEKDFFGVYTTVEEEFRILIASLKSGLPLPDGILESDSVMKITEDSGGTEFRKKYPLSVLTITLSDLTAYSGMELPVENGLYWVVNYSPLMAENPKNHLIFFLDPVTGVILGKKMTSSGSQNSELKPARIELSQNYPNPFNPVSQFSYSLPESGLVIIQFFDVMGREVYHINKGYLPSGTYREAISSVHLGSGLYFYRVQMQNGLERKYSQTLKMVVIK